MALTPSPLSASPRFTKALQLLLVVYRNSLEPLSLGIGSVRRDSAALAIGCHNYSPGDSHFSAFLDSHRERSGTNPPVGARVGGRITDHGIIFPVELPCPLVVRGVTLGVGAVNNDFSIVASSLVHHCVVLVAPAGILDLASFSFQVPICALWAKHTPAVTKQSISANTNVFDFMFPCGRLG